MENWRDVKGYEDLYQVSDMGNVRRDGRILKGGLDNYGYRKINLSKGGVAKTRTFHQLVAEAFLDHEPNGMDYVVNHKNFIKTDNRLINLEIVTSRENSNLKHIKSSSRYTGVSWHKVAKKWAAYITIKNKRIHLGLFINELKAAQAYQTALNELL